MAGKERSRRRPWQGAAWNTSGPGYQACTLLPGRAPWPTAFAFDPFDAPASAASRGWSRVGTRLPCQDQ